MIVTYFKNLVQDVFVVRQTLNNNDVKRKTTNMFKTPKYRSVLRNLLNSNGALSHSQLRRKTRLNASTQRVYTMRLIDAGLIKKTKDGFKINSVKKAASVVNA